MTRGRFITLEGGEGAGKSTQARYVKTWLEQRGRDVIMTREPGGSPLAEAIRNLVLAQWAEGMPAEAELLLMFAARAAHLHATIAPALARGCDVVCDRFVDSSYAYQGAGGGLAVEHLQRLEALVLKGLKPDLTLVFDLDPALGLARTRHRGEQNRFEASTLDYLQRVREQFLLRAAQDPQRCTVIDTSADPQTVQGRIAAVLEARL